MTGGETRAAFLDYFAGKDHLVVPGIPLPLEGDPTLLFTVAGMVPIKPYFLGVKEPPSPRLASVQRCFRTIDIDVVGKTPRHLTFFEMLGNFSVGAYFKRTAIADAWEFVRTNLNLPEDRLWVTVHESDDEAASIWTDEVGFPSARLQRLGKDNFWAAGPTGPCGPCTEIFFDFGESLGPGTTPADDGERFMEIWNLVFMAYDRQPDGSLPPLPSPSVDTGMGLERVAAAVQDTPSVFHTDLFAPLRAALAERAGTEGPEESVRVVLDHLRAAAFIVSDGVYPSNVGRGYVLRRVIRRAVRAGRALGVRDPFLSTLLPAVLAPYAEGSHPLLESRAAEVAAVLLGEEEAFGRTLGKGERELESRLADLQGDTLPGEVAFELYDTHGLPLEATEEAVHARGLTLDREGFEQALQGQRQRSQKDRKEKDTGWEAKGKGGDTARLPDATLTGAGTVLRVATKGDRVRVVVSETPFYPEGGGQVGDHGRILSPQGTPLVEVSDTRTDRGEILHEGRLLAPIAPGDEVALEVCATHRAGCRRAHTATHLLHAALREEYGDSARQAGSLVEPDRLRFDVTAAAPPTEEELARIFGRITEWVAADLPVEAAHTTLAAARAEGAMALFGEKYQDDDVRTVKVGSISLELCGGSHLQSTGSVGAFIPLGVSSIAQGVRRVEAVVGAKAQAKAAAAASALDRLSERWSVRPEQVEERVAALEAKVKALEKGQASSRREQAAAQASDLAAKAEPVGSVSALAAEVSPDLLADLAKALGGRSEPLVALLAGSAQGRIRYTLSATKAAQEAGASAKNLLAELAPLMGGGGGGNAGLAQGGGKNPAGFAAAAARLRQLL